jgi:acyl-coenzyme A thioesterase PaaI-like protein
MSKPDATYSAEVERFVHAAVASAMADFAALLLAWQRRPYY